MRMKETLEYLNQDGSVFKKKSHYLGECPNEEVFKKVCSEFQEKREQANIGRMNLVERIEDQCNKVVIMVKMVLKFEYDQRWTYELVD